MPSPQANDSWANGLKKILGEVAQLSTLQDADLNFANHLQGTIVGHLRQGLQAGFGGFVDPNLSPPALGQQGGGDPSQMGGDPSQAMGQAMAPPDGTMTGGASMGLSPGQPAVSELARILGNTGAVQ